MPDFRTLTLRERLDKFPPFLVLSLSKVRCETLTAEEIKKRLWNRKARAMRKALKRKGVTLPRKQQWRRLTLEEVAAASGIELWLVRIISEGTGWTGISVDDMADFMRGCGFEITHLQKHSAELKRGVKTNKAFGHLNEYEMAQLVRLAERWKAAT